MNLARHMARRPPVPPEQSRLLYSARLRRWFVYGLAAMLVLVIAYLAAGFAMPPDEFDIGVEAIPGVSENAGVERVQVDPGSGDTFLDVRLQDGTLRRFRVTTGEDEPQFWEVPAEQ